MLGECPGICLSRKDLTFGGDNTGGEPRVDRRRLSVHARQAGGGDPEGLS